MKTSILLSLFTLAPSLVSAASAASLTSFCLTYYDSTATTPVPTSTYSATTTMTRTVKSTSTPVTTITPQSATSTKTATSVVKTTTTVSKVTGTYTSTTTFTSSTVVTTVSTSTVTNTIVSTTTDTSPATATPSPDFTPLKAELTPGGYTNFACPSPSQFVARRGLRDLFRRDPDAELAPRATSTSASQSYPASVGCTTLYYATSTSTSVITASTTSTKSLKQGTVITTTTITTTSTSTKVPSTVKLTVVSTTTTTTSTATSVATASTATTTTTTAYQPSSTYYPACQADNLVQCVNGYQVSNPHFVYNIFEISGPANAADCCVACSMNQGCGSSFWYIQTQACYGVIDDVCEGNNSFASFTIQPGDYVPAIFSNSNCGRWGVRAPDS